MGGSSLVVRNVVFDLLCNKALCGAQADIFKLLDFELAPADTPEREVELARVVHILDVALARLIKAWSDEVNFQGDYTRTVLTQKCQSNATAHMSQTGRFMMQLMDKLNGFKNGTTEKLLAPMDKSFKSQVVTVCMKQIQRAFSASTVCAQEPNWEALHDGVWLMTHMSTGHNSLKDAFLVSHSMPLVCKTLHHVTAAYVPEKTVVTPAKRDLHDKSARAVSALLYNVYHTLSAVDGLTWVLQALQAKLLVALLHCVPWIPYIPECPRHHIFLIFGHLARHTMWLSVLGPMLKSIAKVKAMGLDASYVRDLHSGCPCQKGFWIEWDALVERANQRAAMVPASLWESPSASGQDKCANVECGAIRVRGCATQFQQCGRCLAVMYCSKDCQAHDWKVGGHRKLCGDLITRRRAGKPAEHLPEDCEFILSLIRADTIRLEPKIADKFAAMDPDENVLVVKLCYNCDPADLELHTDMKPGSEWDPCDCWEEDEPLREKWRVLKEQRAHLKQRTVLLIAYLARGDRRIPVFRALRFPFGADGGEELLEGLGNSMPRALCDKESDASKSGGDGDSQCA